MKPVPTRHVYCPLCGGTLFALFRRSRRAARLTCSRCETPFHVSWPPLGVLDDDEILIRPIPAETGARS